MEHLLLETPEGALYALGLAVVGHGRLVQVAYLAEESLRFGLLVAALVVGHYLVRLHLPGFQCHAVGVVLGEEVLRTESVAQKDFRAGIHHFIHVDGARHHALLLFVVHLVVKIELCAVAIPQRVRHFRQLGVELRHELILESHFTMNSGIPPQLDAGLVEVIVHRLRRLNPVQSPYFRLPVVLFKYLHIGVYRKPAALQLQQQPPFARTDLAGGLVARIAIHKHLITIAFVCIVFLQQARYAPGQCVPVLPPQVLAKGEESVAHQLLVPEPASAVPAGHIRLFGPHGVQYFGIQCVFRLPFQCDFRGVPFEELHSFAVTVQTFVHG
ncbi:hypothetical protein [Bacteroides oleiciplenus]|uniref:hypothetical protein n=1 Tax=Bacteroides oleiciplenus TaxID=626931 RepID=UPI001FCC6474|nr:hypothetical protein [Bacteroides oleiciplenus]